MIKVKFQDIPHCIADISSVVPNVQKLVQEIKNKDISGAIATVESLIPQISQLVQDCSQ